MVIDTLAVAAILFDEPDAAALEGKIADDPVRLMSRECPLAMPGQSASFKASYAAA